MKNQKKYQISVSGETVRLLSDEKEEYINSIVEYIEHTMRSLNKSGLSFDMSVASQFLFTSVLLTDQLLKERKELQDTKLKLADSELELAALKKEFDQFIIAFDSNR